jgi:transposase InsO family protein
VIAALREEHPEWPISTICRALGVARSSYYYSEIEPDEVELRDSIERTALEFPRYGYRRMTVELRRRGIVANHKHVLRLMREGNLLVSVQRFCRTTNSDHKYGRHPNLLKGLDIERVDQAWCADITYVRLKREFVYLAVVLDIFTRSVRGWELGRNLTEELALTALDRALLTRKPDIHHSDQGVQYAATGYVQRLIGAGVQVSMSARGRPRENAFAERFMRTLKEEEVYLNDYQDYDEAKERIGRFIDEVYMRKRVHSSLGYRTPTEFEADVMAAGSPISAALMIAPSSAASRVN